MEVDEFINTVIASSKQHKNFYHFTDWRNLPSIRQHGLLSTREL